MNYAFLAMGIVCIAYYLACGISVRFNQSILWIWLAAGVVFLLRFAIVQVSISRGQPLPFPQWSVYTVRVICALLLAIFLAVEGMVIHDCFATAPPGVDYLIVLGAKTGSVTMERRVERAAEYLRENPDTICIVSGGQGPDEETTEAQYMRDMLLARGITPDRIITENMSKNTAENIRFSHVYADGSGVSVALVSSDYHMFRAMSLARKEFSGDVYGLPSRSSKLSFPHYAVREFFTITVDTLKGNMEF
jgi:uncharacterized SAM-binding protein YcdF (DUF218 family)